MERRLAKNSNMYDNTSKFASRRAKKVILGLKTQLWRHDVITSRGSQRYFYVKTIALGLFHVWCEFRGNQAWNTDTVVRYHIFLPKIVKLSQISREPLDRFSMGKLRWKGRVSGYKFAPCQNYDPSQNKDATGEKPLRRMLMTSFGGHCSSTSWVRSRKLSMQLGLYAMHVCCEFKRIRAINMAFMPEKPPFLPDDVTLGVDLPPKQLG